MRIPSSWASSGSGTISSASRPSAVAAAARSWERSASMSCAARVISRRTFSASDSSPIPTPPIEQYRPSWTMRSRIGSSGIAAPRAGAAHGVEAADEHAVGLALADHARRDRDRGHAREADVVDRRARRRPRDAAADRRLARGVLAVRRPAGRCRGGCGRARGRGSARASPARRARRGRWGRPPPVHARSAPIGVRAPSTRTAVHAAARVSPAVLQMLRRRCNTGNRCSRPTAPSRSSHRSTRTARPSASRSSQRRSGCTRAPCRGCSPRSTAAVSSAATASCSRRTGARAPRHPRGARPRPHRGRPGAARAPRRGHGGDGQPRRAPGRHGAQRPPGPEQPPHRARRLERPRAAAALHRQRQGAARLRRRRARRAARPHAADDHRAARGCARSSTEIRERGWAAAVEELELGLVAVAAPVFDARGDVVAAVSLAAPVLPPGARGARRRRRALRGDRRARCRRCSASAPRSDRN